MDADAARQSSDAGQHLPPADPYEGLRSPIPLEELARAQGIEPIKNPEELPGWPENDLAAWDGFDEFLEELRQGQRDLARRRSRPDEP